VPTMGALHEGHLSLIRTARAECDEVVVSLFVNPRQFNEAADLAAYPRDEARDAALAAESGADLLYAPSVEEMYPDGFATTVAVSDVGARLEGAQRPGHFDGVATVVTKVLNIVAPEVAYFGQKDAQQVAVIRRLVCDLDLPVRVEALPTVREPDGLALSSRNRYLSPAERSSALALSRALHRVEATGDVAAGRAVLDAEPGVRTDYLERVDPATFRPDPGGPLVVVAARVGTTRLIDNLTLGKA
jgi:pantoate--beta-alanine ligase